MKQHLCDRYWAQFLNDKNEFIPKKLEYYEAFHFGDKKSALEIAGLVKAGIKATTASLQWTYEFESKPFPKIGDYSIITDDTDQPVCIIETLEVKITPFDEVDEQFAYEGGEGDRSLSEWRSIYNEYIADECLRIGKNASGDIPLICERFRVVYRKPLAMEEGE